MSGIIPIPTTRVGDLFVRQRLTSQVQQDQLALFRLQNQLSTGRRIQLPSEDAPAALRAINVQRLLDRKGQIKTNLAASNQYLNGAWDRIGSVSDMLIELRGNVVGVAGNTAPDSERQELAQSINGLLQELVNAGNAKIGGRHLFAGSRSQSQPYDFNRSFVEYSGNDGWLRSYVDLERLFETNMSGTDVFGGVSAAVEGSVDLNPQVTADTLVSTLNGGAGIGRDPAVTVSINDGFTTESSVVDLGGAVTVGDVARLIEAGAPAGADVSVEVTGTGLVLQAAGGVTISVSEVAEGRAAKMLGVLSDPDVPATGTISGLDLNPAMLKTTRLSDLLGKKATGQIQFAGNNNDLQLTANVNGLGLNGVDVVFVDGAAAGSESAVYNSGTQTLTVTIDDGNSTANQVAAVITAEGTFTATIDYRDATSSVQAGFGKVSVGPPNVDITTGGSGEALDTVSGLHLTNGGESVALDISGATTVEDLLNLINGAGLGLVAEVNADGDGINVRSRLSGADFMIGENGGTTATQLGLRTYTGETALASLNRGVGVPTTSTLETLDTAQLDQLRIVARDGATIDVDLTGAATLQDVVALINTDVENNVGTTAVLARLTGGGNRIELVDSSTATTGQLRVEVPPGTTAAEFLGFVPPGATQQSSTETDSSGNHLLGGKKLLGNDFVIVARDGTQLSIDLAGATTVQEVIDRINGNADNVPPKPKVITAQLARVGNGIELIDSSGGAGTLSVQAAEGSLAAQYLGFVAEGQTQSDPADVTVEGANQVLQSEDRNTFETDSVFNTLIRLRTALEANDDIAIGRSLEQLDADISQLNFSRGEIGVRLQNLDAIERRLEDEDVQLRAALSQDIDVDLVEAISQLTARQYAFEASLRTSASMMQLTLLNFL